MHLRKWRTRVKWGFLNKSNLKWKGLSNIIIIIRFYSGSSLLFSIQVVSCHAFPGGRPALELTPSASPACTTLQQSHLCQTFTFHCPLLSPATNLTPGEDCSSDSLAAHSHPRNCPVLAVSPYIRESPGLCLGPSTSQSSWLFFSTFLDCLSTHHSVTVVLHPGHLSLLYIITGQAQAPGEDSCPPRQTQDLPSPCPVDGRPPPPVWSDQTRPWWSWMTRQRTRTTWRYTFNMPVSNLWF